MTRRQELYAKRIKEEFHPEKVDEEIVFLLPKPLAELFRDFLKSKGLSPHTSDAHIFTWVSIVELSIFPEPKNLNALVDEFVQNTATQNVCRF